MDFFNYTNKLQPKAGVILVSEPYLPDPNFERTIILLTEHNEEGSIGFILNKPSDNKLGEVMEDLDNYKGSIFIGGPVQQDTLHILHRHAGISNSVELSDGIYWGGDFEEIASLIETSQIDQDQLRFFLGYSGWSPGQLEDELKEKSWIITDHVTQELVFETSYDQMWRKALKNMGGRFSLYSNYPVDPRMN